MKPKESILVSIVNYGKSQLTYLRRVVRELKSFEKYNVTVIVNSNININSISGIDRVNLIKLQDYQLLPMTCRGVISTNEDKFDYFIYTENDHLWKESHVDKFKEYYEIIPENRLTGLIQYERYNGDKFFPAFHEQYGWDYSSIEVHADKLFITPMNVHQASFIINNSQLKKIKKTHDFTSFLSDDHYSVKCKTNTDIFQYAGFKKLICISDFDDNIIQHLPNIVLDRHRKKFNNNSERMGKWEKWMNYEIKKIKEHANKL